MEKYSGREFLFRLAYVKEMPEEDRFAGVLVAQKISKILHDDVSVIISFHEPIKIIQVMLVNVIKRFLKTEQQIAGFYQLL